MSVTFGIRGTNWDHPLALNLANDNAIDLLAWLGYELELCGKLEARELVDRSRQNARLQ